jgi:hypothetical protein
MPPHWQGLIWGILPFGSSLLAILVIFIPERKRSLQWATESHANEELPVRARMAS